MSEAQKDLLAAQALKVIDLVGYQAGLVVSRVLLKPKGGQRHAVRLR
jgi:hypothetical protein